MSSRKSLSLVASLVMSGIVAFGGARASAAPRELRSQTVLKAGTPQVLVVGPARLLHVDFESAQTVSLYSVPSDVHADACRTSVPAATCKVLRANVRNALNLDVASGQTVCVVADGGAVELAWHAEKTPAAGEPTGTAYASNR